MTLALHSSAVNKNMIKKADPKNAIHYDDKADIIYIMTKKGKEEEFVEVAVGVSVELDRNGQVIGIEILNASHFLKPMAKPLYRHMQYN